MKQSYIDAVNRSRYISKEKKEEMIRDLEEIFAESALHGETGTELEARLGNPESFVHGFETPAEKKRGKKWPFIVLTSVFGTSFVFSLVCYLIMLIRTTFIFGLEDDISIIGGADGPTQIFVQGSQTGVIAGYVLLGAGVLLLGALTFFFGIKLIKRLK